MLKRWATLFVLLAVSWVVMTTSHELGHLVGGWLGGGELKAVDLAPWRLPYSLHTPDPHPRLTLWCGPLVGAFVPPAIAWAIGHRFAFFIGDFCLLANGLYLALGWLSGERFLDTPRMLAAGVHPVGIALFASITIVVGYVRFRKDCMAVLELQVYESPGGTSHAGRQ